jgi:hypothetical protein
MALALAATLALSLGLAAALGVGVELRCDAAACRVASGSFRDAPVAFRFTRAEAQIVRDVGSITRARPGARVACSLPVLVSPDGGQRALLPREVCPVWTALDLVALRQWASGQRASLHVVDWVVGVHLGTFLGTLLGLAWVLGHLLGSERITVDARDGLRVSRGGLASRSSLHLPLSALAGTVGLRFRAAPIASPSPLPTGHLYVETRDGRWHLVTRHREIAARALAALAATGVPHRVASDSEVTTRASGVLLRALVGSALWSAILLAITAGAIAAAFDALVPPLP